MNCDRCINSGICKYEDQFKEVEKSVSSLLDQTEKPNIMEVVYKCKRFHFKERESFFNTNTKKISPIEK